MAQPGQKGRAAPLPPGLELVCDFVTVEEEAALIAAIETSGIAHVDYDPGNLRAERTYGWLYHYSGDYADHGLSPGEPLPEVFEPLRDRAAGLAGVAPESLIQCLLLRYDPGSCIQPHCDMAAWGTVIGLSLGSYVRMEFVNGDAVLPVDLPPRSVYIQTGDARHLWQHSIPLVTQQRWGITFRDFSREGRRMAGLGAAG